VPRALDLFEYALIIPTSSSEMAVASVKPPAPARLSDAQLASNSAISLGAAPTTN
jgi:hypothetical protein